MKKTILLLLMLAISVAFAGGASAAFISTNLDVSATVIAACDDISTTPVNFGTYNNANTDADGSVIVNCLEGSVYGIKMFEGTNFAGGLIQQRQMTASGGATIGYQLFKDAGRSLVWGSCRGGILCLGQATALESNGTGSPQTFTVFGRAFAPGFLQQNPPPGSHVDLVEVQVDF